MNNIDVFYSNEDLHRIVTKLQFDYGKGLGKSGFLLASLLCPYSVVLTDHQKELFEVSETRQREVYSRSFGYLVDEAEMNDGEAMHFLSLYYQSGIPPVTPNLNDSVMWLEKSFNAGFLFAANDLYSIYSNNQSTLFDSIKSQNYLNILEENNIRFVE